MAKKSSSGRGGARKRGQHKPAKPAAKARRSFTLSNLQPPTGSRQRKVRVGRGMGSKLGKTAGSGNKGQKSRRGYSRRRGFEGDRKSTRLNSSHQIISYAVFCLKKKKKE